jgi:hypothetical protein
VHEAMIAAARRILMFPLKIIIPENPSMTSNCNYQTIQKKKPYMSSVQ